MLLIRYPQLNKLQQSVMTGSMLGDGSLSLPKKGLNPTFIIKRALKDEDYLRWEYDLFKEYCKREPYVEHRFDERTEKTYHGIIFYTRAVDVFKPIYEKWYVPKKCVPRDIVLDEYSLLIWFLDDGCVVNNDNGRLDMTLATNGFPKDDVEFLADMLCKRYDASFGVNKSGNGYIIVGADTPTRKFLREIDPICPAFMSRKSDKWRLATNIFDSSIREYRSRKLEPLIDERDLVEFLKSKGLDSFSTRDLAEHCQAFCVKNGKKVLHQDSAKYHLKLLVKQGIVSMFDPGFKKEKTYTVCNTALLDSIIQ